MDVTTLLDRVGEHLNVRKAFGPAYEHDGALLIPVALVMGGGGGGNQIQDHETEGGGFGGVVHPLGAYTVQQGRVRFVPAYEGTVLLMGVLSLLRLIVSRRRPKR